MSEDALRVIFTRSDMRLAGPGRLMIAQAESLRDEGVAVIFATGGGPLAEVATSRGFEHHEIPGLYLETRSIVGTARAMRAMYGLVKRTRPSVVHAYNAHAAMCAVFAARRFGARIFSTVSGRGKERLLRFVPVHYVAVSDFVRRRLIAHGLPSDRISVVPNATIGEDQLVDDHQLAELQSARLAAQRAGKIEICSIAMFTYAKGQDLIIDVLEELCSRDETRVHMTFVGDGHAIEIRKRQAMVSGVEHLCDFVGAQSDVVPYLDRASVFVHLALTETFGLVLAEAGARGLPIVTHQVGGIPEVVAHEMTGLVGTYRSIDAAADAIQRLIDAPDLQLQLGRQGRDRVRTHYTQKAGVKQLLDLYHSHRASAR